MVAILGGLGAALCWAVTLLVAARASRLTDSWSLLASVMTVGLVVTAPWALATGVPADLDSDSAALLLLGGVGNVAGLLCAYTALRAGKVMVVGPIVSTEGAVAAVVAVIAGEHLAPGAGVTLGVIAMGVALAAVTPADEETRRADVRAAMLAGAAALCFGVSLYATGRVGEDLGIAWAVLPPRLVGVVAIAIPLLVLRRWQLPRAAAPFAVVAGLCEVLGFTSFALGARDAVAVSAVLASQFAGIAAVAAYVLFRERLARIQVVGVATIAAGVAVLTGLTG